MLLLGGAIFCVQLQGVWADNGSCPLSLQRMARHNHAKVRKTGHTRLCFCRKCLSRTSFSYFCRVVQLVTTQICTDNCQCRFFLHKNRTAHVYELANSHLLQTFGEGKQAKTPRRAPHRVSARLRPSHFLGCLPAYAEQNAGVPPSGQRVCSQPTDAQS